MKSDELISIIIPVYNIQDYLVCCIESVLAQTYDNLEILLVDDGSTDSSGSICDSYADKDTRIRVIHKDNGGLSDARNIGIYSALGAYIFFLDGDDAISSFTISKLYNAFCDDVDIAIGEMKQFKSTLPQSREKRCNVTVIGYVEAIRRMLLHEGIGHEAWGKLYRRRLWNDVSFPKGLLYEDYATTYKIFTKANKVSIVDEQLYWYRIRGGSIMKSKVTQNNMALIEVAESTTNYLKGKVPEIQNEAQYLQMVTYLKLMQRILDVGFDAFPKEQKKIIDYVKKCKLLLKEPFVQFKDKVKAKSLLISKYLFYFIYSFGKKD